ncbi:hypothetical protein CIB50_0000728 [Kocuria varians]|uniref:DNA (cytosine-5-)-methyltransferase n=1 Tax=Kocuria varians TaxID=1272 RepID=A0A7D7L1L5_KOCVA|nr:hypothetical protein CIB50_0000728 [Kocuria varians]
MVTNPYKLERYGVPQARHRVIVIGICNDLDVTHRVPSNASYADAGVSVRTALTVAPITEAMTGNEPTRQSAIVKERLGLIGPGQNVWNADLPEHLQIKCQTRISQIYCRLHLDQPSCTVIGSGGGGTHIYHWDEPRALTNRERAQLQTFPNSYRFVGSKESVRNRIGTAVPARGARVIFEALLRSFKGEDYA